MLSVREQLHSATAQAVPRRGLLQLRALVHGEQVAAVVRQADHEERAEGREEGLGLPRPPGHARDLARADEARRQVDGPQEAPAVLAPPVPVGLGC